jgi:REP element-mobilizing transposase RayT
MKERKSILKPGGFYHIYNRANGDEVMFRNEENYRYFLVKYQASIHPIAKTCAFCLMPNHFHFLIQIRSEMEIFRNLHNTGIMNKLFEVSQENYHVRMSQLLSLQFSHFFNSYAQSYNKMYHRKGSLFIPNYNRINVRSDSYFIEATLYIHINPIRAGISSRLDEWKYSSYSQFLFRNSNFVEVDLTLDFFDDLDNFIFVHQKTLQGL